MLLKLAKTCQHRVSSEVDAMPRWVSAVVVGSLQSSAAVTPSLESGALTLSLGDLFPSNHGATLIGQGGAFSGTVGSADFVSDTPPYALLKLHSQFGS